MKKNLQAAKLKRQMLLAAVTLGSFCATPALAQLNYRPNSATNVVTTYTDLGTNGSAITVANNDDANSAATPIGFTFNYNGQAFTDFVLNTNGFIKLGTTAPSAATLINAIGSASAADVNMIAALSNVDLQGAANQTTNPTEYRVATTGTAPNRVTTIQFKNLADKATGATPAQFNAMQFQIKLFETTNVIELVYGTWTPNTATPTGQPFIVGIKGSSNALINRVLAYKGSSAAAWSTTTFVTEDPTSPGFLAAHFIRNAVLPDPGRTYRFSPVVISPNDLAVMAVFVQGKMALNGGGQSVIRARVKNNGSAAITNRTVSLNISGANTFTSTVTLANFAAGKDTIVSFAPFTPTTLGSNNFVEVTVPTDGDNTNNSQEANIVVTPNTQGYAQYPTTTNTKPTVQTAFPGQYPQTGATAQTRNSNFLVRFTANGTIRVTTVRAYVPGPAFNAAVNTAGATVYGVVFNSAGVEVARSANVVLTATDIDNLVEFPLTTPATFNANDVYYVGMALPPQPTATALIYPMAVQDEQNGSVRPGTFFVSPVTTTGTSTPVDFNDDTRFVIEADIVDPTGIKEDLNSKLVSVYPNPSNGVFKISANALKGGNTMALEVRDINGRVVYTGTAAKDGATVTLGKLASGVYMLKVSTDAEVAVKRLVIQ